MVWLRPSKFNFSSTKWVQMSANHMVANRFHINRRIRTICFITRVVFKNLIILALNQQPPLVQCNPTSNWFSIWPKLNLKISWLTFVNFKLTPKIYFNIRSSYDEGSMVKFLKICIWGYDRRSDSIMIIYTQLRSEILYRWPCMTLFTRLFSQTNRCYVSSWNANPIELPIVYISTENGTGIIWRYVRFDLEED